MITHLSVSRRAFGTLLLASVPAATAIAQQNVTQQNAVSLPSWREGKTKRAILNFLQATTTAGSPDYVPPAERIAVFDNDGTLWTEQPMYTQVTFALARLQALAPQHPDWATREPFRSALAGDMATLAQGGLRALGQIAIATQADTTPEAFHRIVTDWLATARHPRFQRPYTDCVYQPMLEVLALFRVRGFRTYIASGGTVEFMRPWTEGVYGVRADQVVGSTLKLRYQFQQGRGDLVQTSELDLLDEGPGKPAGIFQLLGQRPIAAFGNSDGDYEMLQYVTSGPGKRLAVLIHHDDGAREYAYDRQSKIGQLDRALTDAPKNGWLVTSMKNDWSRMFSRT
ncbi:MAG: HAD family hydrolase [Dongiaceae bacterium]